MLSNKKEKIETIVDLNNKILADIEELSELIKEYFDIKE